MIDYGPCTPSHGLRPLSSGTSHGSCNHSPRLIGSNWLLEVHSLHILGIHSTNITRCRSVLLPACSDHATSLAGSSWCLRVGAFLAPYISEAPIVVSCGRGPVLKLFSKVPKGFAKASPWKARSAGSWRFHSFDKGLTRLSVVICLQSCGILVECAHVGP